MDKKEERRSDEIIVFHFCPCPSLSSDSGPSNRRQKPVYTIDNMDQLHKLSHLGLALGDGFSRPRLVRAARFARPERLL